MPNVACHTSSFFKNPVVHRRGLKASKRDETTWDRPLSILRGTTMFTIDVCGTALELRRVKHEPVLKCGRSCPQWKKSIRTLLTDRKGKKSLYMLSEQDKGKKKPTENNHSVYFQLVWFHLVASGMKRNWGAPNVQTGIGKTTTPIRPCRGWSDSVFHLCHLWPPTVCPAPVTLPKVKVESDGGVTARGSRLNYLSAQEDGDEQIRWNDVIGPEPRCPMKYWRLFF